MHTRYLRSRCWALEHSTLHQTFWWNQWVDCWPSEKTTQTCLGRAFTDGNLLFRCRTHYIYDSRCEVGIRTRNGYNFNFSKGHLRDGPGLQLKQKPMNSWNARMSIMLRNKNTLASLSSTETFTGEQRRSVMESSFRSVHRQWLNTNLSPGKHVSRRDIVILSVTLQRVSDDWCGRRNGTECRHIPKRGK